MVKRCKFCGKELEYFEKPKDYFFGNAIPHIYRKYKRCRCTKSSVSLSTVLAILSWVFLITTIGTLLSYLIPVNISFLEIGLFSAATVILLLSAILFTIKSIKRRRTTLQTKLQTSKKIWSCLYCQEDLNQIGELEITTCQKCGNKIPVCAMCDDSIFNEDNVYQLKPCKHLFHKICMYEWMAENKNCPICEEVIKEVDIDMSDL